MPLETAQMLSSVYARYDEEGPYLPVHQKHPCTLWAGSTIENYKWLWNLGNALLKEYTTVLTSAVKYSRYYVVRHAS
jgi:hypothetical protein